MKNWRFFSCLLVVLLAIVLVLIFTYPAILNLNTQLIGVQGDNYEYFGFQYLAKENILQLKHPFADSNTFRYPYGFVFSKSFDGVFAVLLGAILMLILEPVLAYNLSVVTILVINILASFILFDYLSKSKKIAFIMAFLYGLSAYSLARSASHLNLALIAGWPLLAFSVLKLFAKNFKTKYIYLFFLALLILACGSLQYLLMLIPIFLFLLILSLVFYFKNIKRLFNKTKKHWGDFLAASFLFIFSFIFLFAGYLKAIFANSLVMRDRVEVFLGHRVNLLDFLLPNAYLPKFLDFLNSPRDRSMEASVFLGFAEIALFLLSLVFLKKQKLKIFILLNFSVISFLALGFYYQYLMAFFPFSGISEPQRLVVLLSLLILILVTLFLKQVKNKINKLVFNLLLIFIFVVAFLDRAAFAYPLSPILQDKHTEIVKDLEGEAVFIVPSVPLESPTGSRYDILPVWYHKKITDGYIHWSGNDDPSLLFLNHPLIQFFRPRKMQQQDLAQVIDKLKQQSSLDLYNLLKKNKINIIAIQTDDKYYYDEFLATRVAIDYFFPEQLIIEPQINTEAKSLEYVHNNYHLPFAYSLFFTHNGVFSLENFSIDPEIDLEIYLNKQLATDSAQLRNIDVPAGSKLEFRAKEAMSENIFFGAWYSFTRSAKEQSLSKQLPKFQEIYQDQNRRVIILN